jgi:ABC-type multidrug transport system fused ATPase/permease subunit
MKAHHRNIRFRPPRREKDRRVGSVRLYFRFQREYLWPYRRPIAVCALLLSLNACMPYVMAFYGRVVVDRILVVETAAAPAAAAGPRADAPGAASRDRAPAARPPPARGEGRRLDLGFGASVRPVGAMPRLMGMFALYTGTLVALNLLSRLLQRTRVRIGQQLTARLREDLHEKVLQLSLSYHKAHAPGRLLARIMSDVGMVQDQMMATILDVVSNGVMLLVGFVILLRVEPRMALIAAAVMPAYVILYRRSSRVMKEIGSELRHTNSCLFSLASQKLEAVRAIQAYSRERHEDLNFHRLSSCFLRDALLQQRLGAGLGRAAGIVSSLGTGLVFLYGATRVLEGDMTLGRMMFAYGSATHLFGPVLALSTLNVTVTNLLVILQRLVYVLDEPVEIRDAPDAVPFPRPLRKGLTMRHLNFRYTPGTDPILEDVLIHVPAGSWLCVMGASGTGKTTLLYLLSRLYEPQGGEVLVDDVPLNRVAMESLRRGVAMVPQEPPIFSGTVRENICYGYPDARPSQIVAAARAAELHDFVMTLPVKYETVLGERGTSLSGGQRQRLALARALLADPEILLLDDGTSALDADTERRIQETLTRVLRGRTAVIVSQRVSMARRCRRIAVLADGLVSELGSHEELLANGGFYARLHAQQTADDRAAARR